MHILWYVFPQINSARQGWESSASCWNSWFASHIEGILLKGPYLPCVSMAGRALLAGYHRHIMHISSHIIYDEFLNHSLFNKLKNFQPLYWSMLMQSGAHFTKAWWTHIWNFVKIILLLCVLLLIQSVHKFAVVFAVELSWHVQNCELLPMCIVKVSGTIFYEILVMGL